MVDTKCTFCSDIVNDTDHFDRHDLHIRLIKDKSGRTFARKDLLKQHVHLATANDYTKRGLQPPDQWSECHSTHEFRCFVVRILPVDVRMNSLTDGPRCVTFPKRHGIN
jgi:hypothetical protein